LGVVLRLVLFFFQDDKHADAPMRALIAERLNLEASARASTAAFCQFGPLPIELMRPFLSLSSALSWPGGASFTSRLLALLCGVLTLPLFARYAAAWTEDSKGPGAPQAAAPASADLASADLALLALAVSPLGLQLSTTASSEALYLFLVLGAAWTLRSFEITRKPATWIVTGMLFSLAAVARFDAWLGLPAAALAWFWADNTASRRRRVLVPLALLGVASVLPLAYVAWSARTTGDPFFFARFIQGDHQRLGAAATARFGAVGARGRQVLLWLVSALAAATPALLLGIGRLRWRALVDARKHGARPWQVAILAFGLTPIFIYVLQGLSTGEFEPLPRFAFLPCVLLLPAAASRLTELGGWSKRPVVVGVLGLGFSVLMAVIARAGTGRIWGGAESLGAWTHLDAEDRALADLLRTHRAPHEVVFIDPLAFIDIAIAHAADVPQTDVATLTRTRSHQRTLSASFARTSARWFAAHDAGWGREGIPDWPALSVSLGGWHVVHLDDEGRALPIEP